MRSEIEVEVAIDRYANTVNRICMTYLKNYHDTEDIFQTVFLKYAQSTESFESREHEKAWIIRVTVNACKDLLKSFFCSKTVPIETVLNRYECLDEGSSQVLEAVLSLPEKYRVPIYLHYYEGYTAPEIGSILNKNTNTVYTLLNRAKQILQTELRGEHFA